MAAGISLNAHETRVLGVLIEKELTTPEGYPLSINAATNGANQKSNRDPVVDFMEAEVQVALTGLLMKGLAGKVVTAGSRVEKYRHNARETLGATSEELAVLAELMMRGSQQAGELRARAARMAPIATQDALMGLLARLIDKGFVRRLATRPGERAERYTQLLGPSASGLEAPGAAEPSSAAKVSSSLESAPARALSLEARVAALETRLADLEARLGG